MKTIIVLLMTLCTTGLGRVFKIYISLGWFGSITHWLGSDSVK